MRRGTRQRRRENLARYFKFMPTLLHRGLQHGDIHRRIGAVPPGGQCRLRAAPIARVAGLPGHSDVLARLRCRRRRANPRGC